VSFSAAFQFTGLVSTVQPDTENAGLTVTTSLAEQTDTGEYAESVTL
jgi:hypothetical protein